MWMLGRRDWILATALLSLGVACATPSAFEISRERATEIARSQVSFQPDSIEAERSISSARPVWRITLRGRLPAQPPGLFETVIVEVDRQSGAIVSLART